MNLSIVSVKFLLSTSSYGLTSIARVGNVRSGQVNKSFYSSLSYNQQSNWKNTLISLRHSDLKSFAEHSNFKGKSLPCISYFNIQKRNFSVKESFDSAVITHSKVFRTLSESTIVEYAQNSVIQFHDTTGLPWWVSIVMTTCLIRSVVTLPLAIYQTYVIARLENARREMDDIVNNIKYELNREVRRNKWSEKKAQRHFRMMVKKEWTRLIERDNCHPAKAALLAFVQIPLWVVLSTAFRNLVYKLPNNDTFAELKHLELTVGGVAWFPNLTVPDSFVIPITLGLVNLTIVEIQAMMHKGQRTTLQRYGTNFFRGFSIFMIPVAASIPACITLYWTTSSVFGLCQNLMILSPRIRSLMRIPSTPSALPHPYSHLAEQIRNRFK